MSRAFVKEQDVDHLEMPERPVSEHPNEVTEAGLAQIEHALAAASEAYAAAQASADRAALVPPQGETFATDPPGARTRVVAAPTEYSEVRFGTSVTIVRDDGGKQTFRIVGEDEADLGRLDLAYLAAGEIDVRKTRRRRGQSR